MEEGKKIIGKQNVSWIINNVKSSCNLIRILPLMDCSWLAAWRAFWPFPEISPLYLCYLSWNIYLRMFNCLFTLGCLQLGQERCESWEQVYCIFSAPPTVDVPEGSYVHQRKSSLFYFAEVGLMSGPALEQRLDQWSSLRRCPRFMLCSLPLGHGCYQGWWSLSLAAGWNGPLTGVGGGGQWTPTAKPTSAPAHKNLSNFYTLFPALTTE